ncbi:MAG: hypothetical protein PHT78_03865 [Desulfitobacteriaceae bacterium]|nr:hypothetical protein [Desulfitobacteriaceae bacterium]MDD4752381.1 hypothetical protein [Desulfitobacteriaceae bacterium]
MYEYEIKKTKKILFMIYFIVLAIIVVAVAGIFLYKYQHTFTTEKWIEDPKKRVNLVDDLLAKYDLVGMTEEEILALLGEDSGDNAYYQDDNNFVYYLGDERGLISIDSEWLIVKFFHGIANEITVTTD